MSATIPGKTTALRYRRPDGTVALHVVSSFCDRQALAHKADFDRFEQLEVRPAGGAAPAQPMRWIGLAGEHDWHAATLAGVSAAVDRVDVRAELRGSGTSSELWHKDVPVHDVGEVDAQGIAWHKIDLALLQDQGAPLCEDLASNGVRVRLGRGHGAASVPWLQVRLELFAPGITNLVPWTRGRTSILRDDLKVRLESPMWPGGTLPLTYEANAGVDGNNFVASTWLSRPSVPDGLYPVTVKAGDRVLGWFLVDYRA